MKVCSICGKSKLSVVYRDVEFNVCRCRGCGALLSGYETPDGAEEYDAGYFRDFETHYRPHRLKQYRQLLPMLAEASPGRRLLDVGCALGYFVEEAQRDGWDAAGIDISGAAVTHATQVRGMSNLICGKFEDHALSSRWFHAITFLDVLEHMRRPREALQRARDLLVPDGIIAIKVPSTSGLILRSVLLMSLLSGKRVDKVKPHFRGHLFYFTPESLRHLIESAGFKILALRRQPDRLIILNDHKPATIPKVGIKYLLSLPELVVPAARSAILAIAQNTCGPSGSRGTA